MSLLTVYEACERLRVGRTTIYRIMDSGELTFVRVGSRRRISEQAIEDYVHRDDVDAGIQDGQAPAGSNGHLEGRSPTGCASADTSSAPRR